MCYCTPTVRTPSCGPLCAPPPGRQRVEPLCPPCDAADMTEALDRLAVLRASAAQIEAQYEEACEADLTKKQRLRRQSHAAARDMLLQPVLSAMALLEELIRRAVLTHGESIKGRALHAVYQSGRVTWDSAGLDGYMLAGHPELADLKKIGPPSVTIREVK